MFTNIKRQLLGLLLTAISLTAVCDETDRSQAPTSPPATDSELIYNAINTREWRLAFLDPDTGEPRLGTTVFEKSVGGLVCRKTVPVVLEPIPRFQCYLQLSLTSELAMTLYNLMDTKALRVSYLDPVTGQPRVGTIVTNKTLDDLICESIAPVIPNPVPRYSCYVDIQEDALRLEKRRLNKERRHWSDDWN